MVCQTYRSLPRGDFSAPLLAVAVLSIIFAGMQETTAFPTWRLEVWCDHFAFDTATETLNKPFYLRPQDLME